MVRITKKSGGKGKLLSKERSSHLLLGAGRRRIPPRIDMPRSLSALERGNPPPRRKSCSACIKAKRRCDQGAPACLRCRQRNLECQYSSGPAQRKIAPGLTPTEPDAASTDSDQGESRLVAHFVDSDPPLFSDHQPGSTTQEVADTDLNMLDFMLDIPEEPLNLFSPSTWEVPASLELMHPPQVQKSKVFPNRNEGGIDAVSFAIRTRLQYAIDTILNTPRQMVEENQTPWCHPQLYKHGMPRVLEGRLQFQLLPFILVWVYYFSLAGTFRLISR